MLLHRSAGQVSPHAVNHGQVNHIPSDGTGRVRQGGRPRETKSRPRQERSPRPDEDLRFNTGPRSLRQLTGSRIGGRRSGRIDRGPDAIYDDGANSFFFSPRAGAN